MQVQWAFDLGAVVAKQMFAPPPWKGSCSFYGSLQVIGVC